MRLVLAAAFAAAFAAAGPAGAQEPSPTGAPAGPVQNGRRIQPTQGSVSNAEANDSGAAARTASEQKLDRAEQRDRAASKSICVGC